MMENRLWAALCALLLINLGSAEHDDGHATATIASQSGGGETASVAPVAESVPASSMDTISHAVTSRSPNDPDTNPSSRVTISLSNNTATGGRNISLTPEAKTDNGTNVVSPSEAAVPGNNLTDQMTSQSPPSGSHTPTSHIPLASTTIRPLHTAHTAPVDITLTTTLPATTLHQSAFPLSDSSTKSNQSRTSVSTPESEATTTSAIAQSSTASSTSSSQEAPTSVSPSLTSPQTASQPDRHSETSSVAKQTSTITTPSSPSAQAKVHANTPSQLNVGGDTRIVHDSPTLDPLLAGLVSAFIITAVIVTLLLFLKLRQRDNRPEFRRLQDLPMDDIMEDTPLSMYSY